MTKEAVGAFLALACMIASLAVAVHLQALYPEVRNLSIFSENGGTLAALVIFMFGMGVGLGMEI